MSSISLTNGIRIHALQTGTVAIKELQRDGGGRSRRSLARVFADRRWTEPLPILVWLIEHPEGLIVVDTGETARVSEPGYFPAWHPYFRFGLREWVAPEEEIGPQIRRLGFSPDDVRWVVLTHFHTDHAGGLAHFPHSEIVCSRADYEYSGGLLGRARGFLPQHLPAWFSPTLIETGARPFGPFAQSTALTAAGDVHLLPTPGHTPGHLSVALEDGETVFLFAADASYTEERMLAGAADGVSPDPAAARATLERIQRLAAARPTVYLPTHDPAATARLARREVVSPEVIQPHNVYRPVIVGDEEVLELDGRDVRLSSPGKVLFGEHGETKRDLVDYYLRVGEPLLRTMGGRPVLMQRFPRGAEGPSFFQKRVPQNAPEWLRTTTVTTVNGTPSRALVIADLAHVVWAVNFGCLGFHVWPYRAADPEHCDELRLDLDPQPGTDFADVRRAAAEVKALLDELGVVGYPKTTGNRGLHVYVRLEPRWDSYAVRSAAVAVARELERRRPDVVTAAWWKEERGERIFIDYNQNAPHKTVFGAWGARARPGGQVSAPLRWDEVSELHPDDLTQATVPDRLEQRGDPWEDMDAAPQSLDPLLAMHERDRANGLLDAPWPPVYPKMPDEPPRVAPSRARKPD